MDGRHPQDREGPDVIVVGGGAAGAVLAARLTEDPAVHVLLLEAGPDYASPAEFPDDLLDANHLPQSHDWGYRSEPGVLGRSIPVPSGRVIGGSTSLNAAVAGRGLPGDFDGWSRLGNPGWSHAELLDFFRRLEDDPDGDVRFHGRGGPVPIRRDTDKLTPLNRAFVRAAADRGFPCIESIDAADRQGGVGILGRNVIDDVRINSALAYLHSARGRGNLQIRGGAEVDRLLVEDGSVQGVALTSGEALAGGRVVLCAGVYGSPAILLRSGIGPRDDLEAIGIETLADVPGVGANLAEQPFFFTVFAADPDKLEHLTPPVQTILWVSEPDTGDRPWLHIIPNTFAPHDISPTGTAFALGVALLNPRSRGRVFLASRDAKAAPVIDLNLLADPEDVSAMIDGVRLARRLGRTEPLASLHHGELLPGEDTEDDDDATLAEILQNGIGIYNHASGSVRMGPSSDPAAVVDASGQVRAVRNLTVADASIMPTPPANVTALTTFAIAEKIVCDLRISLTRPGARPGDGRESDALVDA